ncbi:hypothetical protein AGRO_2255 [Agrobacterium sp. ATCC 31749]|nr:hypothetical protein AGRO_2255 [Agrobacterium sp. ATCC 31749]
MCRSIHLPHISPLPSTGAPPSTTSSTLIQATCHVYISNSSNRTQNFTTNRTCRLPLKSHRNHRQNRHHRINMYSFNLIKIK